METYYVQEFAKIAGVTVRTLRYYDQTGLLQPARRSGMRLYQQNDLLRLQQILTLKAMGFTLEEIRDLLDSPAYDVRESLRIQKAALDRRVEQLRQASRALERTLEMIGSDEEMDWAHVATIIRIVSSDEKQEWLRQYYTDEQWDKLTNRHTAQEEMRAGERAWMALSEAFKAHRHLPPEHPDVQKLAARQAELVNQFTQGDPGLQASLEAMYRDYDKMPEEYRLHDADLQNFMNEAARIYRERNET